MIKEEEEESSTTSMAFIEYKLRIANLQTAKALGLFPEQQPEGEQDADTTIDKTRG